MLRYPAIVMGVVLLTAGCQASACVGSSCGGGKIDTAKAQNATRTVIAQQTGAQVASVTCPKNVAEKRGASFTCTAVGADGTHAAVLVTQTDDKGSVHISAPGLLHTGAVANDIAARVSRQVKVAVRVRCPDLLNAHRGTTLTCRATDPAGMVRSVVVTVTDAQGSIDYRLR